MALSLLLLTVVSSVSQNQEMELLTASNGQSGCCRIPVGEAADFTDYFQSGNNPDTGVETCKQACLNDPTCLAAEYGISYKTRSVRCELHKTNVRITSTATTCDCYEKVNIPNVTSPTAGFTSFQGLSSAGFKCPNCKTEAIAAGTSAECATACNIAVNCLAFEFASGMCTVYFQDLEEVCGSPVTTTEAVATTEPATTTPETTVAPTTPEPQKCFTPLCDFTLYQDRCCRIPSGNPPPVVDVTSEEECNNLCLGNPSCTAVEYYTSGQFIKRCQIFSTFPVTPSERPGPCSCRVKETFEAIGRGYCRSSVSPYRPYSVLSTSAEGCATTCQQDSGCQGYEFNNANGNSNCELFATPPTAFKSNGNVDCFVKAETVYVATTSITKTTITTTTETKTTQTTITTGTTTTPKATPPPTCTVDALRLVDDSDSCEDFYGIIEEWMGKGSDMDNTPIISNLELCCCLSRFDMQTITMVGPSNCYLEGLMLDAGTLQSSIRQCAGDLPMESSSYVTQCAGDVIVTSSAAPDNGE
eukprot:m.332356 g.332356  ORF g.332356 m.332356 type:complete len:529 (+) comp16936_c0_seq1:246-1832(+)